MGLNVFQMLSSAVLVGGFRGLEKQILFSKEHKIICLESFFVFFSSHEKETLSGAVVSSELRHSLKTALDIELLLLFS